MFIFAIFFCWIALIFCSHIPPEIPLCKASDEECLKSSAEIAFSNLVNGNEELAIPPLDPLAMDTVVVEPKPGPINIYQKYVDTTITGVTKAKVNQFSIDLKPCQIIMELIIPELEINTKYEIKGQLLILPVASKGDAIVKFRNFLIQANVGCELFKDQDIEFIRATNIAVKFSPEQAEFNLGKLISGNDELDKQVHKVIDDDPIAFFEVMKPAAEESWSYKLKEIVNDFFTKVPRHEMFKE